VAHSLYPHLDLLQLGCALTDRHPSAIRRACVTGYSFKIRVTLPVFLGLELPSRGDKAGTTTQCMGSFELLAS
jgi:hypothetical protein